MNVNDVFAADFLHQLARLRLRPHFRQATRPGNTPFPRTWQTAGLEVTRHQPYGVGDEVRHVDWNIYGRLGRLVVKRFRAEREVPLHLLIDTSASMTVPRTDYKFDFARVLAASLAYIALHQHDPVRVVPVGGDLESVAPSPWFSHTGRLPELQRWLDCLSASGRTALDDRVREYLRGANRPGFAVLISDFLVTNGALASAVAALQQGGFGVALVRPLGSEEWAPEATGKAVRLRDAEDGSERHVLLNTRSLRTYREAIERHLTELRQLARGHGIVISIPDPTKGVRSCLFTDLTKAGILY